MGDVLDEDDGLLASTAIPAPGLSAMTGSDLENHMFDNIQESREKGNPRFESISLPSITAHIIPAVPLSSRVRLLQQKAESIVNAFI